MKLKKGHRPKDYGKIAELARKTSWILLNLLVLNLVVTHVITGIDTIFRILVSCAPLLIFMPGLLARRRRSASLLCFALLLYFVVFVSALGVPGHLVSEIISTTLTTLIFISAMMFSTWQYRADLTQLEQDQLHKNIEPQTSGELSL